MFVVVLSHLFPLPGLAISLEHRIAYILPIVMSSQHRDRRATVRKNNSSTLSPCLDKGKALNTHMRTHMHTHTCNHTHANTGTQAHKHKQTRIRMHARVHAHEELSTRTSIHTQSRAHTHTQSCARTHTQSHTRARVRPRTQTARVSKNAPYPDRPSFHIHCSERERVCPLLHGIRHSCGQRCQILWSSVNAVPGWAGLGRACHWQFAIWLLPPLRANGAFKEQPFTVKGGVVANQGQHGDHTPPPHPLPWPCTL